MNKIEQTLQVLKDKNECHRLIDEMPDNAQALFLVVDYDKPFAKNVIFGHPTSERLLWMIEEFKRFLFYSADLVYDDDEECGC